MDIAMMTLLNVMEAGEEKRIEAVILLRSSMRLVGGK